MLRAVPLLALVLFAIISAAQTADDFRVRYGRPDAEKFRVRPEITLTVRYGEDDAACEMLIEPSNSDHSHSNKELSMATAMVSAIIDELIPQWQRGALLNHLIENMGAAEYQVFEYQNARIGRHFVRYLPAHHDEASATIIRKDKLCGSSIASQEDVSTIELTDNDLHLRYGDPVARRLKIRPDVSVTVT